MAQFTNETMYGYVDGEHIGNWGTQYPIFIRVVGGVCYPVGREEGPGWIGQPRYMSMMKMSRDWMKLAPCKDYPGDADLFQDTVNATPDTSMPGSAFVKTANTSDGLFKRPNKNASTTPTTTSNPNTGSITDPTANQNPTTTGNNNNNTPAQTATTNTGGITPISAQNLTTSTGSTVSATAKTAMPLWVKIGFGIAGLGLIVGLTMWFMQRKK